MNTEVVFWRRLDVPGLERLELDHGAKGLTARSRVLTLEHGGYELVHRWWMDAAWQVHAVVLDRRDPHGGQRLVLERDGPGWKVDGARRADLDGTAMPDLSATPLCNSFAIHALRGSAANGLDLEVAFIDAATLRVSRSRQRYVRQSAGRYRYVDLGVAAGFEADLVVDGAGLVVHYEHLFSREYPEDHAVFGAG